MAFVLALGQAVAYNLLFEDGFETATVATFPDSPGGSSPAWLGPYEQPGVVSYNMEVTDSVAYTGAKSLYMQTDPMDYWIRAVASFTGATDDYVIVDYYVRIGNQIPAENRCAIIKCVDGSGTIAAQVTFNDYYTPGTLDDHVFYGSNETAYIDTGFVYSLDNWYHLKIVMNQSNETYSLYIDDMNTPIAAQVDYYTADVGNIEEVWFEIDAEWPEVFLDNVRVFEDSAPPTLDHIIVRDAPGGGGSEAVDFTMPEDETRTFYAAGYSAGGVYLGDVSVSWSLSESFDVGDLTSISGTGTTFDPDNCGKGTLTADDGNGHTDDITTIGVYPYIASAVLAPDNGYIDITFSEGVYDTMSGSGALETGDITIAFAPNGGTATVTGISGITNTSGDPLVGGETVVRLHITITGQASGVETVLARPADDGSIFCTAGVAILQTETTGFLTLNPFDPSVVTTTADSGPGSLRERIIWANGNPGHDTIFVPSGTYYLTKVGSGENACVTGDLDITDELTIIGTDPTYTIIDGNGADRVFHIDGPTLVTMSGLWIRNGENGSGDGGAILVQGSQSLTLSEVTVSDSDASDQKGGAIYYGSGTLTLTNVTLSGNSAKDGGAICSQSGPAFLTNVTITNNTATSKGSAINPGSGTFTVKNTIIANNLVAPQCDSAIGSAGNNIDSGTTCGFTGPESNVDPLLGPLQDNGGPTPTHALLTGSPAIDSGTNTGAPATDQRGVARPIDGDTDTTAITDIGAYEYEPPPDTAPVVTNTSDSGPGSLRSCITYANNNPGTTISFDIPNTDPGYTSSGGDSWWHIQPASILPAITAAGTVIDGTTQTTNRGDTNNQGPEIELDGISIGTTDPNGLTIQGGNCTLRGLVINRCGDDAIEIEVAGNNIVEGCYIGTDITGTIARGNGWGISVKSDNNKIGGTTAAARNIISGNSNHGIFIYNSALSNTIEGNYIGTDRTGSVNLGNGDSGIRLTEGTMNNTIGGNTASARNVISGNIDGIYLEGPGTDSNRIQGNYIGTDAAAASDLGNSDRGIQIESGANNNIVGGTGTGLRNVISGNDNGGIVIGDGANPGLGATGNIIQGNYIGTDATGTSPLGNTAHGVQITTVDNNTIGGTDPNAGNIIAHNSWKGVLVQNNTAASNAVLGNSIHSNGSIGIDLGDDGVTVNNGTKDAGLSNYDMDYPVFTSVALSGTTLTLIGYVGNAPNQAVFADARVEVFTSDQDGTGHGEGETYIGSLTADANGNFSGSLTVSGLIVGDVITGTATDASGNTSEFGSNTVVETGLEITGGALAADNSHVDVSFSEGVYNTAGGAGALEVSDFAIVFTQNGGGATAAVISSLSNTSAGALVGGESVIRVHLSITGTPTGEETVELTPVDSSSIFNAGGNATPVTETTGLLTLNPYDPSVVTTTADSGAGSLREAINYANSNPGTTITFNIPGPANQSDGGESWWRIAPASALPMITADGTVIDATSQAANQGDTNGRGPEIELNGASAGPGASGLTISASGITVRGLVINQFKESGIALIGGSGNTIAGNYLGPDATGSVGEIGNVQQGILIYQSTDNIIGGIWTSDRNVISGNRQRGIWIDDNGDGPAVGASGTQIVGNYIGTNASGTGRLPFSEGATPQYQQIGIALWDSVNTVIGGTGTGEGNVVSGNSWYGIYIWGPASNDNVIRGNTIGLDAAGAGSVANGFESLVRAGVLISSAAGNTVGGSLPGAGNTIAGNAASGLNIAGTDATDNAISGNSIYGNTGMGIDLGGDGVTANDGLKSAGEPNVHMDFPIFTSAVLSGTTLTLTGYVGSSPNQSTFSNARVEVFKSDEDGTGYGEGETYLGFLTADANGNISGSLTVSGLTVGDMITGTATDASGNTSEFGPNRVVEESVVSITGGVLAADNGYVDVSFSEGVYNTAGGSGALEVSDFSIGFTQNGGNATGASISSLSNTSGGALVGGEAVIRVHLSITGTPSGVETVEITPADSSSIFNVGGNAAPATESTGTLTLNDQSEPELVEGISIRDNVVNPRRGDRTTIVIELPGTETVKIAVYDLAGDYVKTITDSRLNRGVHTFTWDGKSRNNRNCVKGLYFIVVKLGGSRSVFKVLVVN
jgi:parallel beta-helix repeat protein